jgi:tetratricopeptide (TPR) repeat protein
VLEDYKRAVNHFQHALELDPRNHRAAFMLGIVEMVNFHLQGAKIDLEEALKLEPQNPFYHLHYGILLSRLGDNASAIGQALVAEKLDPSYALTHYNLGHLYKETGDYDNSRKELEAAIHLRPNLSEAYYQLGWVYHRLGMEEKSRKAYQEFQQAKAQQAQEVRDPVESNLLRPEP